jgi:hypothetical protein
MSNHNYNSLTLQMFHVNLLVTEAVSSTYADNSLRTGCELTCTKLADLYSTRTAHTLLELHCFLCLLKTLESDMRRTQRRVLLRLTSLRSRGPSLLLRHPVLLRNLATHGAARSEGKEGEARRDSAPLLLRNRVPWGFWILSAPAWGDYPTILIYRYW